MAKAKKAGKGRPSKRGPYKKKSNINLKTGKRKYMKRTNDTSDNEAEGTSIESHPGLFQIESGIPIQVYRLARQEVVDLQRNLASIIPQMKVDQSFVMLRKNMTTAKRFLEDTFKNQQFKMSIIVPEKKFVRVWRVR